MSDGAAAGGFVLGLAPVVALTSAGGWAHRTISSRTGKLDSPGYAVAIIASRSKGTLAAWWHYLVHGIVAGSAKLAAGVAVTIGALMAKLKVILIPMLSVIITVVVLGIAAIYFLGLPLIASGWLAFSEQWAVAFGA